MQNGEGRNLIRHLLPGIKVSLQSAKTTVKTEGDYIFKTVAYRRKGAGLDTPVMEQLIDGVVVNTVTVEANSFEVAEVYSSPPVHLKAGPHLMEVRWPLKDGQTTPTLEEIGAQGISGKGEEPPGFYHRWSEFYGPRTVQSDVFAHRADLPPREGAKEVITRLASKAFRRRRPRRKLAGS